MNFRCRVNIVNYRYYFTYNAVIEVIPTLETTNHEYFNRLVVAIEHVADIVKWTSGHNQTDRGRRPWCGRPMPELHNHRRDDVTRTQGLSK